MYEYKIVIYILYYIQKLIYMRGIQSFKHFNPNITFNVREVAIKKGGVSRSYDKVKPQDLDKYLKNKHTHNIYFRPEDPRFVLVDLDNKPLMFMEKLNRQIWDWCFILYQTSALNYQAWAFVRNVKTWKQYIEVGNWLAGYLDADKKAVKSKQVGRLPGSINHKPHKNRYETNLIGLGNSKSFEHAFKEEGNYSLSPSSSSGDAKTQPKKTIDKGSQLDDRHDWAFANEVLEKDNTKTKRDLYNILCTVSKNGHNKKYIEKTVDSVFNYRKK